MTGVVTIVWSAAPQNHFHEEVTLKYKQIEQKYIYDSNNDENKTNSFNDIQQRATTHTYKHTHTHEHKTDNRENHEKKSLFLEWRLQ